MAEIRSRLRLIWVLLLSIIGIFGVLWMPSQAMELAQLSVTPLQIEIVTATPLPPDALTTPLPSFTPSPDVQSVAQLQAKPDAGDVNVRSAPELGENIVGKIAYGDLYVVTGRYYRWLRLRYEAAPNSVAWVFEDLIEITGDAAQITDLSALPQVTADSALVAATQTAEQLLLTPGAVLTLTAASRELQGPVPVGGTGQPDDNAPAAATDVRAILPTFTYPPEVALLGTPAADQGSIPDPQDDNTAQTASDDAALPTVPIVVPILALGGFGLLGLAVSTLRR